MNTCCIGSLFLILDTVKKFLVDFDIKRQKLSKSLWLKDLGDTIKINFLGKFFENIFTLDRLIHFHVISAVVDFRLPCKWHAPLTAKLESWQWVILARRKQVLRYHVSTRSWCKQIGHTLLFHLSCICDKDVVSADLFCLLRTRFNPHLSYYRKKSLKIVKLVPGMFYEWCGHPP